MDDAADNPNADESKTTTARRGFWGLADQGVVSAGNFFVNILLANAWPDAEYGQFGLLFMTLLVANSIHQAVVTYPLSVRIGGGLGATVAQTTGGAMAFTAALTPLIATLIGVAAWRVECLYLLPLLAGVSLCWQLQETTRRALIADQRAKSAIFGDAISYLGQAAVIFGLTHTGRATLPLVFIVLAGTSLLGSAVQMIQLRITPATLRFTSEQIRYHWLLGRWLLLNNAIAIVSLQAIPWTVKEFHGLAEAAKITALGNVLGVTHPAVIGLSGLLMPAVARTRAAAGLLAARKTALRYALGGVIMLLPIWLVMGLLPDFVLTQFYREPDNDFRTLGSLLRLYVVVYVVDYAATMTLSMLAGLERSRDVFITSIACLAVTICLTIPLAAAFSIKGGLYGAIVADSVRLFAAILLARRLFRSSSPIPTS